MGQVRFGETGNGRQRQEESGPRGPSIDSVLNQPLVITKVEQEIGMDGLPVLYITAQGVTGRIRTGSKVLLTQAAERIKPHTDAGNEVTATIIQKRSKTTGKNYYSFA